MRFSLVLLSCLALARVASGQGSDAFADPSATPYPPVYPVVALPAQMPAAISAIPLTIATLGALTPDKPALVVGQFDRATLLAVLASAAANPTALATAIQGAPAPTRAAIFTALATAPEAALQFISTLAAGGSLGQALTGVKADTLYSLLAATAKSPETAALLLKAIDGSGGIGRVLAVVQDRMTKLSVDESAGVDMDILAAVSAFASTDPRFRDIGNYSAFGRQLFAVRQRVATEGHMTPEDKAEIIRIYQDATAALKAFQAAEHGQ